jgi:hypothetical protein
MLDVCRRLVQHGFDGLGGILDPELPQRADRKTFQCPLPKIAAAARVAPAGGPAPALHPVVYSDVRLPEENGE